MVTCPCAEGQAHRRDTGHDRPYALGMCPKGLTLRDLFVVCVLVTLAFSLISEVRKPCANFGRCDSLACSFLWR